MLFADWIKRYWHKSRSKIMRSGQSTNGSILFFVHKMSRSNVQNLMIHINEHIFKFLRISLVDAVIRTWFWYRHFVPSHCERKKSTISLHQSFSRSPHNARKPILPTLSFKIKKTNKVWNLQGQSLYQLTSNITFTNNTWGKW